jgi:hypothetical protein
MSLTQSQRINLYAWCLEEGVSLEYGKLSLCDLRNFRHSSLKDNRRYQVHCEDHTYPWSMIYEEVEPAIIKFLELKTKIKRVK